MRRLQALARQSLPGVNFVGMVEATLWKDWGPDGLFVGDWVSWHAHLLVCGATGAEIRALLAPLKRREVPFYGECVVDVRAFGRSELVAKAVYILKAPIKHYRVVPYRYEWINEITGEVRPPGLRIKKDWMRSGDRVRLLDVFVGRDLGSLLFGDGAGTALARAIRADARRRV